MKVSERIRCSLKALTCVEQVELVCTQAMKGSVDIYQELVVVDCVFADGSSGVYRIYFW